MVFPKIAFLVSLNPINNTKKSLPAVPSRPIPTGIRSDHISHSWADLRTTRPIEPRGLSRREAAAYVGVSIRTFNRLTAAGVLPQRLASLGRWDKHKLDAAFEKLAGAEAEVAQVADEDYITKWRRERAEMKAQSR